VDLNSDEIMVYRLNYSKGKVMARKRSQDAETALSAQSQGTGAAAAAAPARTKKDRGTRSKASPARSNSEAIPAVPSENSEASSVSISNLADAVAEIDIDISHDEIARLAYLYAEARGFQGGSSDDDWFRAERELRQRAVTLKAVAAGN
jgi:hypothetical protein